MTKIRCAVYTRKSSEEGLEQGFNSLDAQREACAAYILSQAGEGWEAVPTRYDDGGVSGGTMDRPALKHLLADIEAGLIDTVVTYKIDRLSRSLADFSRMVELFDAKSVTFVSVTQAFNTTTSMGRLTLNVLLSFAQFEREVTGERIRDKIEASKKRGLFMGGRLPLGYDAPGPGEPRHLKVNAVEAGTVRFIFRRYLELGSVHALVRELDARGIRSKSWTSRRGNEVGGRRIGRGALFYLLRNRTYLGLTPHRDASYEGGHAAIVDRPLFEAVQDRLDAAARRSANATRRTTREAPLKGKLVTSTGEAMVPTHARSKSGRLYRYYVAASLTRGVAASDGDSTSGPRRVSAAALERTIEEAVGRLSDQHDVLPLVRRVTIEPASLRVLLDVPEEQLDRSKLTEGERLLPCPERTDGALLVLPSPFSTAEGRTTTRLPASPADGPDPRIVRALREAHAMVEWTNGREPAADAAPASPHGRKLVRLALLAPDLQHRLLTEAPPAGLTLSKLLDRHLPLDWDAQREMFERG